jgi:hypothetical protein
VAVDALPNRIALFLEQIGAEHERRSERHWRIRLPSATRGAVRAGLTLRERTLTVQAFVLRGPDRDHAGVYRRLLRKNLDTRHWRFALDDAGDVFAVADAPLAGLDADGLDGLLGALAALVDETYEGVVRQGFEVPDDAEVRAPADDA